MFTITVWLLIFSANGNRPAVVIDKYTKQEQCEAALARLPGGQLVFCLKSEH